MPYLGSTPNASFSSRTKQDFTANGSTTAFTLSSAVASANDIEVFVGNVRQEPTDAYTVNGTTLTMSAAPSNGINFYVIFKGVEENSVVPADGTISSAKIAGNAISTAKIANDAITNAKIGAGAVDATEIASSLNLSSKTLTMPQKFNGLQHMITVNPVGTNAFVQDLSSYEQVMVFFNNVEASSSGANIRINFGTASDGTTNGTTMNYIYYDLFVNDSSNLVGVQTANSDAILIDNHWGSANAGTNGYFLIGGIGTGNTTNKRISYSGLMMKQSPSNQEAEIVGGQMQNDSNKYTHCKIRTTGGNFAGSTRFTFFGVNHYNV
jgi:hypothetical protein